MPPVSCNGRDLGGVEGVEPGHDGDAYLDFSGLMGEGS